ncbi:hypothetical protein TNCV_1476181 [Trichonephila clavipes]|nr:hypothetical protein TNCV_1476181 [Trichonephila clavipes]
MLAGKRVLHGYYSSQHKLEHDYGNPRKYELSYQIDDIIGIGDRFDKNLYCQGTFEKSEGSPLLENYNIWDRNIFPTGNKSVETFGSKLNLYKGILANWRQHLELLTYRPAEGIKDLVDLAQPGV